MNDNSPLASTGFPLLSRCRQSTWWEACQRFVFRMDQDGSLNISYDEWRDYLLLAPATDIHALIHFWRHSTVVGPCARSARIATTILLANPAVKQQCLHCCVSAWRAVLLATSPSTSPSLGMRRNVRVHVVVHVVLQQRAQHHQYGH
ncbi:hypothetical protein MSG28_001179 [Choristoneura fumiferana]|uniref:Uncharacterized protein n=1 Tax=Choristoneura fumiferana TaxID=7141 RepID=A0ACC0K437_CHOFU|nr:hypothetical protein MSG28_001179 [Choristoneura fumiferana]